MTKHLAPSILSADFTRLGEGFSDIAQGGATYVHLDVMDGHFVPNISFGIPVVESLRKFADQNGINMVFDAHLMIANPKNYITPFAKVGADIITFHYEACQNADEAAQIIQMIRGEGKKAGIAINPDTPVEAVKNLLPGVDMALIMSVVPGFGGQGFIQHTLEKARQIRSWFPNLDIQMDGGVNLSNIQEVAENGVNIIVVGSAIFNHKDVAAKTREFVDLIM
ncbi:MAG: ribulose-phosphate 3-epimerase [Defluviitaleaceae bacterium]|nr:ribulose-phosphate 3-epimerase [Defluviitaleaceae bacterium]